ncbi:MAG TPA: YciI family protein [Terriglobales bacterium]
MKYMMLIYFDEKVINESQRQQCYQDSAQFAHQLEARGQYLAAAPLHPVATATTVRTEDGRRLVTDGPFAETREQLGGYFLIDAKNLDEAINIAASLPAGKWGCVEIRPVIEVPTLPENSVPANVDPEVARSI